MKKGKLILLLVFLLVFSAVTTYIVVDFLNEEEVEETELDKVEEDTNLEKTYRSPLSGIKTTQEISTRRPVAVMFDNHPKARWQAGLSEAEIAYELPVENPYTRYIGIFLINEPKSLGPIRSTRPYLVQTIAGYDPIYVRCGGSEDGKREVRNNNIADIDCLESQAFTRSSSKRAPNNLYISMSNIRKEQTRLGYGDYSNYEGYKFNEADKDITGTDGASVEIYYNANNNTKYEYDIEKKIYRRYKDGELHIDESDKSTVTAKNIIIQQTDSRILDDEGRKKIGVIGSGSGMYITNGKVKNITWIKSSAKEKTVYQDDDGEIYLNEGNTWIQVVDSATNITIR